ncbi:hypothetical protein DITRI_Ditri01bG0197300 [Diplodiscus trichospermus]
MASFSPPKHCEIALFSMVLISMLVVDATSFQFKVGGKKGWTKPTGNESETYNEWAAMNRFHVRDSLYFKYKNDSVLVVNRTSYKNCSVSDPIFKFEDGDTVFQCDRYGFFYFISGEPGHCRAGQRLIVRVIVQSAISSPQPAPSPGEGGSDDGGDGWDDSFSRPPPPWNSSIKLTVASCFMTVLGGMVVIMYLLM